MSLQTANIRDDAFPVTWTRIHGTDGIAIQPAPSDIVFGPPIYLQTPLGAAWGQTGYLSWERAVAIDITGDGRHEIVISTTPEGSNQRPESSNPLVVLGFRDDALVDLTEDLLPGPLGGSIVRNFVTADFNGDGLIDLLVNNTGTEAFWPFPGERNVLLLSDGTGRYIDASDTLPTYTDFSHGSVAADFNGNGLIDLFINNLGERDNHISYLLFNDGVGGFSEPEHYNGLFGWPKSPRFDETFDFINSSYHADLMDYGGNGIADIYWGYVHWFGPEELRPDNLGFGVAVNDGHGNFTMVYDDRLAPDIPLHLVYDGTIAGEMTRAGDLNGNGLIDLVVFWDGPEFDHFQILMNRGPDGYEDVSHLLPGQENGNRLPNVSGTPDFYLTDINGNGALDIMMTRWTGDFSAQQVIWFENDGAGNFTRIDAASFPGTFKAIIADVNGDGIPDIIYDISVWAADAVADDGLEYAAVRLGAIPNAVERTGRAISEVIAGGDGSDILRATGGDNVLHGNGGDDVLVSGTGNDTLIGGPGQDRFVISPGGHATIADFQIGQDTLDLRDIALNVSQQVNFIADLVATEAGMTADFGTQGKLTLAGLTPGGLEQMEVLFGAPVTSLPLQGNVQGRGGTPLDAVAIRFFAEHGEELDGVTNPDGTFALELDFGSSGRLTATRSHAPSHDEAPSANDALDVLRMAVGLAPSWGVAGPMDFIAADMNGDGRVDASDALEVLRMAVGLQSSHAPRWVFVEADADLSGLGRTNTLVEPGLWIEQLSEALSDITFKGILTGNLIDYP